MSRARPCSAPLVHGRNSRGESCPWCSRLQRRIARLRAEHGLTLDQAAQVVQREATS